MTQKSLQEGLKTKSFGKQLFYFETTDSTNTRFFELLNNINILEGAVVIAGTQTKGRGTSGNKWISSTPEGLWMSILLYEPIFHNPLSFLPAIATVKTLNEIYKVSAHLKWPNDILFSQKKIGGILCENFHVNNKKGWIIGIGINLNQSSFPNEIRNKAISLHQITGKVYEIEFFFQNFLTEFENLYFSKIDLIETWKKYSNIIGKDIQAIKDKKLRLVKVENVSAIGSLIVKNEEGILEEWFSVSDLDINTAY
ncbi:biotin--[acetyl-CoA-carboxylase] ligase [Emticicia sp. 21SJ11W-3]|uniref:biotin--[acetyl-CoA-carboxylase] ligase n=1 Tax=Emticicia sp. 21SJ11W-3 TaxID=2916755 RepID=UPI00209F503F|nr:biotin--[acetyl-CoA-carboxylase] ligase [Emticicia sp. 21SJ11W-3]UTA68507.1 biotin--[acetyl-CoA-carboxylase] ligase [Emticicia sp. 21SJ11W-3]